MTARQPSAPLTLEGIVERVVFADRWDRGLSNPSAMRRDPGDGAPGDAVRCSPAATITTRYCAQSNDRGNGPM